MQGETAGFHVIALSEVDSTNKYACELASSGQDKVWIVAERQTGGRGSRGRKWSSLSGNLFASLLLQNPADPVHLHELTFVAALALRSAIHELSNGQVNAGLKWPNDVLIAGKKCAGILLEGSQTPAGRYVVIGVGVNCEQSPKQTAWPSTSLSAVGIKANKDAVFACLAGCFARYFTKWGGGAGFPCFAARMVGSRLWHGPECLGQASWKCQCT